MSKGKEKKTANTEARKYKNGDKSKSRVKDKTKIKGINCKTETGVKKDGVTEGVLDRLLCCHVRYDSINSKFLSLNWSRWW